MKTERAMVKGLFAFISTLLLFLSSISGAQENCAALVSVKPGVLEIKTAHNLTIEILGLLSLPRPSLETQNLYNRIAAMEMAWQKYLTAAGFTFKVKENAHVLKGEWNGVLPYRTYTLTGSATGDMNAKLIHGIQSGKYSKKYPVKFIFNPLQEAMSASAASFHPNSWEIILGHRALAYRTMGIQDGLIHEIHHYFEEIKIREGEMTLARLEFKNSGGNNENYQRFLRMDELETYIRGVRLAMNEPLAQKRTDDLRPTISNPKTFENISANRFATAAQDIKNIKKWAELLKSHLQKIETELSPTGGWSVFRNDKFGDQKSVVFLMGNESQYRKVEIDINKLISEEAAEKRDATSIYLALRSVIDFSRERAEQIQKEITSLELIQQQKSRELQQP